MGYKVTLDRSPGAGKFVSVEIWEPTDLDRGDVFRNDPVTGKGRFYWNAEIHGSGWPPIRQGRITIANTMTKATESTSPRPLLNTYLTFTDENWNVPQTVTVNIHCAQHDVTTPLPIWHFAFRHADNGGVEEHPPGYATNRKGDNSPRNTSLRIAQVRVADSTAPAAVTSDIAGGIELDPKRSLSVIKKSSGDGLVRRIGLDFTWNNPDSSHTNDYQHAREKFTGFRVTLRSLEDGTVQERFVPTFDSTSPDFFQIPFYANFEAESVGATVDRYGFAQPTDTNDEKFEWSVVPVNWRWADVGAERATRCVLMTYRKPSGTIPYVDTDATPTCPAAQQGESEGASAPAVSVPDTPVANVQATAACVSADLLQHVEARIATATTDRWERIRNALTGQPNAITLAEVKEIHDNRKANGLALNRFDEVIAAMECIEAAKQQTPVPDETPDPGPNPDPVPDPDPTPTPDPDPIPEPVACVSPQLRSDVEGYSEETWHGSAHVERWLRVLQTFSGTANDSVEITLAEAQEMAETYSAGRWNPVVEAIKCLEQQALDSG